MKKPGLYSLWKVDSLPNYQLSIQNTEPGARFSYLEYISYSKHLIKIEIWVIVTPDVTLVNNDSRSVIPKIYTEEK